MSLNVEGSRLLRLGRKLRLGPPEALLVLRMPSGRLWFIAISCGLALFALMLLGSAASSYDDLSDEAGEARENPCTGPDAARLRCPDLQMRRPYDLTTERTPNGHVLLRATSAIKSRGRGPIEIHGRRSGGLA